MIEFLLGVLLIIGCTTGLVLYGLSSSGLLRPPDRNGGAPGWAAEAMRQNHAEGRTARNVRFTPDGSGWVEYDPTTPPLFVDDITGANRWQRTDRP